MSILLSIAAILIAIVAYAATKPDHFKISRSIDIHAPARLVFDQINDFQAWRTWSPWEDKDPNLSRNYSGPAHGQGTHYSWTGNKQVGTGEMTIQESVPHSSVRIALHFIKPFEAHNIADFDIAEQSPTQTNLQASRVTWTMSGPQPMLAKVMGLFFSMEKMVGPDFEKGLVNLKAQCERQA